ncbi:MAG: hypothetical protein RIR70_1989 [Pseudomonadota bacterium]
MPAAISVIIPSRLDAARATALWRAIESIRAQQGVRAQIIIAANGTAQNAALGQAFKHAPDVTLLRLPQANLKAARLAGRQAVETPYFCFLDDDDEYLPDALSSRLQPMQQNATIDVVVGRGDRMEGGVRQDSGRAQIGPPLVELITHNWLTSCGAVYRTLSVPPSYFSALPDYFEWTYLAFALCLERRVHFIEARGHLIHDTPASLSKSAAYADAHAKVMARILALPLPADIRRALRHRYGAALHDLAEHHRATGQRASAWRCHLASLIQPGGGRYLAFTRKLCLALL